LNNSKNLFASIVSDNPKNIFDNLVNLEEFGIAGIHFDVMDGSFVPRLGLYPELLSEIKSNTTKFIEVHMMVQKPSMFIHQFVDCGADRIIVHMETEENISDLISQINELGVQCGLALNPLTEIESLTPYLQDIDAIMLMAINPGIPKHPFIPEIENKLIALKGLVESEGLNLEIIIDGGVIFENVETLFKYGANTLICGSGTLFNPKHSIKENLRKLHELLN
jgi:ribulose-phosphate 3-epimerase